jgi:MFS family permease
VNIGLAVYLPVYLQSVLGLSVSDSGLALLGLMLGTVAGAMTSGRMVAKLHHYRRIAVVGTLLCLSCLVALGFVAAERSFPLVEILTAGVGIGAGMNFPVCTVSVQNAVDRAHLGVATGVLTFLRSLGAALGVAALGAIALGYGLPLGREGGAAVVGTVSTAPFATIFFASAAAIAVAFVLLLLMPERPLQGRAEPPPVMPE